MTSYLDNTLRININDDFEVDIQFDAARFQLAVTATVSDLITLYEEIILEKEGVVSIASPEHVNNLQSLTGDFFHAWIISSWLVIEAVGAKRTFSVLKMLSAIKIVAWVYDDCEWFENLPDVITIFRGGEGAKEEVMKGYSWSTNLAVAEQFARMHACGSILVGEIYKDDVLLLNPSQDELVADPNTIRKIALLKQHSKS
jgi:hypothetical protein